MGTAYIDVRYATESSRRLGWPICQRDRISLNAESTTIGRDPAAGIHLDFGGCRRMEAEIVRRGDRYFILPLEASNGTRVNDTMISFLQEVELHHGDRINVGASSGHGFWLEFSHETDVSESSKAGETS
jgi:pSer/pThr/pTyr-binding forkhead associated (FHA) protein